ncbi:MAG: hypothetical protein K2H30_03270, partial [Clostridia bacterium]|nr:hypothetical protein [Clostridia bacterium]
AEEVYQIKKPSSLLGCFKKDADEYLKWVAKKDEQDIPEEVKDLAKRRWQAKQDKNWAEADALRGQIDALGYVIKDSKDGYTVSKK